MIFVSIILFLFLSAFFSGSEIAFISANKLGVEVERQKGSRRGKILAKFFDNPQSFLGTMLVGNNIALVVFTLLMQQVTEPFLGNLNFIWNTLLNALLSTVIVLIFGEFLPKTIFRVFANNILKLFAFPLVFFKWLLAIPSWIMTKLSNLIIIYIFRTPLEEAENVFTRVDLEDYIDEQNVENEEDRLDTDLFKNALKLKETKVRECMIPRPEIAHLDISSSIEELIEYFKETQHSRIIISNGEIDNVKGYVHHQQILDNPKQLRRIIMDIPFIPEQMSVSDLMASFIKSGTNLACVVDEYGGTAGIITMEDILEEIFGEIEDEHDSEDYVETQISENEYIFSGRLEIDYINDKYESLDLPEGNEYHTLSGCIVMTDGDIPEQGHEIEMDGYKFIVELVSEKKIETVRIIKLEVEDDENE